MANILIVDDDQDFVEAVKSVLVSGGHRVVAAYSRETGMDAVKKENPDLMILDVMMEQPDDGFAMAHDLRKAEFKKPILMLSSVGTISGMTFDKDSDMNPVDAFEEKPIKPERLLAKVKELLGA
ncbi:MAG TPA: response regulator transcription factor [bacterium]|nr:response regulator transcription factor [bacterium]